MSGFSMEITLDDMSAERTINRLLDGARNMTPLMKVISKSLESDVKDNFQNQESPDGQPWKPSRRAQMEGGETLLDSGRLADSYIGQSGKDYAEVGSNVIYAAIQQFGGTIRPKNGKALRFKIGGKFITIKSVTLPARPHVGIGPDDADRIKNITVNYFKEISREAG